MRYLHATPRCIDLKPAIAGVEFSSETARTSMPGRWVGGDGERELFERGGEEGGMNWRAGGRGIR